jgi:hypothetical protein
LLSLHLDPRVFLARRRFWRREITMRRRPGISGLQTAAAARDQYRSLGENVAKIRTDLMKEQLATFRNQLEEFARKHKVCSSILSVTFVFFCTSPLFFRQGKKGGNNVHYGRKK